MKLQDVIHYYIGCNMTHKDNLGAAYILHFEAIWDAVNHGDMPVLRRLEDMTEEEATALAKLQHNPKYKDIDVLYIKPDSLHYIDGTRWHGDGVSEYNEFFVYFNQLRPTQFHYLLTQHFDLFNLIDAGLAIDAKTITS